MTETPKGPTSEESVKIIGIIPIPKHYRGRNPTVRIPSHGTSSLALLEVNARHEMRLNIDGEGVGSDTPSRH